MFTSRNSRNIMNQKGSGGFALGVALALAMVASARQSEAQFSADGSRMVPAHPASYRTNDSNAGAMAYESVPSVAACGCGGAASCLTCGGTGRIPPAVWMCPPQQPTGVTSGACRPCITGIDCAQGPAGEKRWRDAQGIDFEPLWHGEYIGPVRLPSLLEYRVRVNDEILITYFPNRQLVMQEYKLTPGDELNINSVTDDSIRREKVQIQPDGNIVVPMVGSVRAAGKTVSQLRKDLEAEYKKYFNIPAMNVEPSKVNTVVEDLKDAVNGPFAAGGRVLQANVNPDGKIQIVGVGSVYVLGMTLDEIKRELNLRYNERFPGIEVEPRLSRTAQHFVFVFGEVNNQNKFELTGPTTVTQALSLAGGLKLGANNRQVVIFRRAEDWRLISTVLDLRGAHLGKRPTPSDEIWLRDSDLIIVPPRPITRFNNATQQIFTEGLYRIVPFQGLTVQRNQ
jgi:polysaccharide biosynthesis/export protein